MKNTFIFTILLSLFACSCRSIKYKPDLGFMNSAQANSMEYYVRINDKICKDMDNKVGLCAKRIASNKKLTFSFDVRPYSYTLTLRCTGAIDSDFSIDIAKGSLYSFSIIPEKFSHVKTFTCIGEIFPHDRDQQISATFHVRVVVFDGKYVERELVYTKMKRKSKFIVFGSHAKYVTYNNKHYKNKPSIKTKSFKQFGYSESERMRFNYINQ